MRTAFIEVVILAKMLELVTAFIFCFSIFGANAHFVIPPVSIQVFTSKGISVSIPDVPGIKMFGFHGKVNEIIDGKEDKDISGNVMLQINKRWTLYKKDATLKKNDIIYYWVFVQHDYFGYRKDAQFYEVDQLLSDDAFSEIEPTCTPSITKTSNGGMICKDTLIFSDKFETNIDESKWVIEHKFPSDQQESPFVSYQKSNVKLVNEKIEITPTILSEATIWDEEYVLDNTDISMGPECTGTANECKQSGMNVLPIISGRISTRNKFSFKYGKIEIIAKLPVGSWLYPELYLEPAEHFYGSNGYESGVMRIAFARGNNEYVVEGKTFDNTMLYGGIVLTKDENCRRLTLKETKNEIPWGGNFHKYVLIWESDKITLQVDDRTYGVIEYHEGLKSMGKNCPEIKNASTAWGDEPTLVPFDQEFYISLGVGVAGIIDFPDTKKNSLFESSTKPWKNIGRKAKQTFWDDRKNWYKSWSNEDKKLIIDSVNVWAV